MAKLVWTIVVMGFFTGGALFWGFSVYTGMQMHRTRLPGSWGIPFISTDPDCISSEGLYWRRRHYRAMAGFLLCWLACVSLYGIARIMGWR